jgi:hypothetical protein
MVCVRDGSGTLLELGAWSEAEHYLREGLQSHDAGEKHGQAQPTDPEKRTLSTDPPVFWRGRFLRPVDTLGAAAAGRARTA